VVGGVGGEHDPVSQGEAAGMERRQEEPLDAPGGIGKGAAVVRLGLSAECACRSGARRTRRVPASGMGHSYSCFPVSAVLRAALQCPTSHPHRAEVLWFVRVDRLTLWRETNILRDTQSRSFRSAGQDLVGVDLHAYIL